MISINAVLFHHHHGGGSQLSEGQNEHPKNDEKESKKMTILLYREALQLWID